MPGGEMVNTIHRFKVWKDGTGSWEEIIPSCEKAIIVKTGSDASTLAIRIARGFTNKEKIWSVDEFHPPILFLF